MRIIKLSRRLVVVRITRRAEDESHRDRQSRERSSGVKFNLYLASRCDPIPSPQRVDPVVFSFRRGAFRGDAWLYLMLQAETKLALLRSAYRTNHFPFLRTAAGIA